MQTEMNDFNGDHKQFASYPKWIKKSTKSKRMVANMDSNIKEDMVLVAVVGIKSALHFHSKKKNLSYQTIPMDTHQTS